VSNRLEAGLRKLAAELDRGGTGWALVGGLAVSIRSEPRFTRDIDVAVAVSDDQEAAAIVRRFGERGYLLHSLVEQDAVGRLATARLTAPGQQREGIVVDLLFASSGIEGEVVAAAERLIVLADVQAPVARVGHLIALKLLSADDRRPLDRADALALTRVCGVEEIELARTALALIEHRGFNRGRDLQAALAQLLRLAGGAG
jgi:predicted nucleotidyltransferase